MKKYELTSETINFKGVKLYRIRALISFGIIKAGDLGGYIEKEENLSQEGNAWVGGCARVCDNAIVKDNAIVCDYAVVSNNSIIHNNAIVRHNARVYDNIRICNNAWVGGDVLVCGNATICDNANLYNNADYATIEGFGSAWRLTTFFKQKDGSIGVSCGCFHGTLDEFRAKVKETHKDNKYAKEYLMIADLMEMHFKEE